MGVRWVGARGVCTCLAQLPGSLTSAPRVLHLHAARACVRATAPYLPVPFISPCPAPCEFAKPESRSSTPALTLSFGCRRLCMTRAFTVGAVGIVPLVLVL